MRILGIDTSTFTGGVALVDDDEVVAEYSAVVTRTNSEGVCAVCGRLLAEAGWVASDLDAVAVAIGPGSFTGVRIGVTMAKVLAYALDLPIGTVVTLDAIAANLPFSEALVCPLISARRDIVYTATYRMHGAYPERLSDYEAKGIREVLEGLRAAAVAPEAHAGGLAGGPAKVLFVGDGARVHKQVILESAGDTFALGPDWCVGPRPAVVAAMGRLAVGSGRARNAFEVEPFYLGRSSAETAQRGAVSCGRRA